MDEIPFGGVGESGYGRQPLKYTFEEFVYSRSVLEVPFRLVLSFLPPICVCFHADVRYSEEPKFGGRYPPSSKETLDFFEGCLKVPIPSVEELGGKIDGSNGTSKV